MAQNEDQKTQNHRTALEQPQVSAEQNGTPTPPVVKKRHCGKCVLMISAVIFLSIFFLIAALATPFGQHKLIQLADKLMDSLSIERTEGDLQQGLVLTNLTYQQQGVKTHLAQARVQLDFHCLMQKQVCLRDLSLQDPQIEIDTALLPPSEEKTETSKPMHKIELPISVQMDQVNVQNLQVKIDENQINLARFHTALRLNNEQGFTLAPTQIDQLIVQMQSNASTQAENKDTKSASNEAKNPPIDWQTLEQKLSQPLLADLPNIVLPFDFHIQNIEGTQWQYVSTNGEQKQQINLPHLQLKADTNGDRVELQTLSIESSVGTLEGQGQIQLAEQFPLNVKLQSHIAQIEQEKQLVLPKTDLTLNLSGELRGKTQLDVQTTGGINAHLNAEAQLNVERTPLNLSLSSQNVQYPFDLKEKDPLKIKDLSLQVSGDLLDYHIQLNGNAQGMGVPRTELTSLINGGLSQATISQFQLKTLQGTANLQGNISWADGVQWQSGLDFAQLNITPYLPTMPAVLSGKLATQGEIKGQKWQMQVADLAINGTLSRQPLSLVGELNASNDNLLTIPNLVLDYGKNHIAVKGNVGKQSDLALNIQAPDLKGLLPDLSASLAGYANLKGDIHSPNIDVDLTGSRIHFQQLQLNQFSLKGRISADQVIQGSLEVDINGLHYDSFALNQANLSLKGDEKNHSLQLQSQGKPVAANLKITGNFDRTSQVWKGVLSGVDIQSPIGKWQTNQAVNIAYNQQKIEANIASHCWLNSDIELCFPTAFTAGKSVELPFQLRKLDLNLVNKLLEKEQFKGILQSNGKVEWATNQPLKLNVELTGNHLEVAEKLDYRTFRLPISNLTVKAQMANDQLHLDSQVDLADNGRLKTQLSVQDLAKSRTLGGSISVQHLNLKLANQLLSSGEKVNGEIMANLTLGGNLNNPLLHGNFDVNQISAITKTLPFEIRQGNLALRFMGNHSTLQGALQTPDSRLDLSGDADWRDIEHWNTHLIAKADRFSVNIPAMAKLKVSPNVALSASPKLLDISGTVDIPWARIAIEDLPDSAVAVSSDEVILDGPDKTKITSLTQGQIKAQTQSGMQIRSDLKIIIGKEVTLKAYGLKSSLNGTLSVQQDNGNLGLYGQIYLQNGRYAAYGQDLFIRKGQISFSGLPSQPMLNIEAIRNPATMENSNVTAGVKVIGLASSPEITVFSDPASSQDEALSYLLTGRSLENSGEAGTGGSIGAALLGMGLAKSGKLVGGIGEAFGVQDLSLGTQGVGDSSKVTVSGNITPRLQLKYGVGLFDGLAEFTVRYKLLPQLYLQSVSGVSQAVDLLYHFDF
ncbi:autotransporter assembly complex protein TamB [Avibacterium paragallinarum]|uniref:autotransporter assembly complex protein TamB n=1 Tax=Avibacterium paragallinarum TaxID=728 RepID=UPI00406C34D0